jgi:hypothetical protein
MNSSGSRTLAALLAAGALTISVPAAAQVAHNAVDASHHGSNHDPADYAKPFNAGQWARLQAIFPTGVCDWSKPGLEQQDPLGTWIFLN